ncbi:MAG: undecaprenyl-phosphate glucose phosphotransferase [Actinomycetota bacterium]
MRHLDVDQPQGYRAWPHILRPGPAAGRGEPPALLAHGLRDAMMAGGRALDAAAVAVAGWLAGPAPSPAVAAVAALLAVQLLQLAGGYDHEHSYADARRLWAAALLPATAVLAAGTGVSPWMAVASLLAVLARLAWAPALGLAARRSRAARRVLVVGDRSRALDVLCLLVADGRRWNIPVGILVDVEAPARPLLGGFIAGLDEIERVVADEAVDDVVVALPWSDTPRLAHCLDKLRPLAVDVHLFPEDATPYAGGAGVSVLAGVPMARLAARPLSGWRAAAKAVEDRVLGVLALLAASPVMLAVAVAIKLDSPGPVLFRQQRYGYDNKPFTCFKFRSMRVRPQEAEVRQASRDDPRVTRVGRFIRRTSLDELPQLFNVIAGSMSLVGPRPHAVSHHHHYARLVDDYRCRHRMKPGITGWAQVNGYRGETATVELMRKRVIFDLWYIDHWSVGLDLKIMAMTPLACLRGTNAY